MAKELTINETKLIYNILTTKMEYTREELLSNNASGLNSLLLDDFVMFSVCYHMNRLSEKIIDLNNLNGSIKSINKKFNYNK